MIIKPSEIINKTLPPPSAIPQAVREASRQSLTTLLPIPGKVTNLNSTSCSADLQYRQSTMLFPHHSYNFRPYKDSKLKHTKSTRVPKQRLSTILERSASLH
ncbi:hypothetical protein EUGRSUZ_E03245 [Eucalyptus grandis]|uniref:Uncharacterized protein n=2 Tax=Eucalyptus grandis TaxID=71139 RepID=A0ACC3KYF1_EUCGR|nr:hypothetical protein EUGRSUZ_E03245 [Eucalyptus grandis]